MTNRTGIEQGRSPAPRVMVLGCGLGGLAAIRSLGARGFSVLAVSDRRDDVGLASRFVAATAHCPSPLDDEEFTDFILGLRSEWEGALVLDTEDRYTRVVSTHRDRLQGPFVVAAPGIECTSWFLDKARTHELATRAGVAVPAVHTLQEHSDVESVARSWTFPVLVKPLHSQQFVARFGEKLWVVSDRLALAEAYRRADAAGLPVLAQEIIPGSDKGTLESVELYVNADGSWGPEQCNVKLRQAPPGFGVMRVGRSIPMIDELRTAARTLLTAASYRGFASLEFKRDPRDGVPKLIEVNPRLPRNLELLIRSGVDFPWVMHEDLVGGRHHDLAAGRATFIDGRAEVVQAVLRDRGVLLRPGELIGPYLDDNRTFSVWSWADPHPFLRLLWRDAGKVQSRLTARVFASGSGAPK